MSLNPLARPQRTLRAPELRPQMTPAQQRAQDASVRNLTHIMREAEAYLDARADAADAERARLCPCGIAVRSCQCPLRQAKRAAPGIS